MSTRSQVSLLATLVAVLAMARLLVIESLLGAGAISIAAQVLAVAFMLWARLVFGRRSFHAAADDTPGELVMRGPYAIVRNPIYASIILFVAAGAAAHPSAESIVLAAVVAGAMLVRILIEERFLRARYREYPEYAKRVKWLVPFVF